MGLNMAGFVANSLDPDQMPYHFKVDPLPEGSQNKFDKVASLESVFIPFFSSLKITIRLIADCVEMSIRTFASYVT